MWTINTKVTMWLLPAWILMLVSLSIAAADSQVCIGREHYAYQAVGNWAERGLLAGYPAEEFEGPESLTRYEVAALILRAAEGIGEEIQQEGAMLEQLAEPVAPTEEESVVDEEIAAIERGPGIYPEDIAMLEKLVSEFRTELAALGARVDELEGLLASMEKRLAKTEEELRRHKISGYLQFRFTDDRADEASNFSMRRARLSLSGPVSEKTSYKFQLQMDKGGGQRTVMRYGWIDVALSKESRLRAGQAQLPMGYELLESSSARLEPERAVVMDRLFPDQGDIGLQWHWQREPIKPAIDLAIVNGTGINASDDNDRKDVAAAVLLPFSTGSLTLGGYDGRTGSEGSAQVKERLLAGLDLGKKQTQLRGEYVRGRDLGEDVMGWYTRLSQRLTENGTLYVKYEEFDENRGRGDDLFQRWSAGWVEEIDDRTRLSLAWETRKVGSAFSEHDDYTGDAAVAQLQVKF